MAHPWIDQSRPVYPGTVKEGYLVKSPPLGRKGVKVCCAARPTSKPNLHIIVALETEVVRVHQPRE